MEGSATRASLKRWGAMAFGSLIAFLLMAPLFAGLVAGAGLDARPAFFLVGIAVLVDVAAVAFDKVGNAPHVNRIQAGLLVAGIVYFVVSVLISI
jgi:hypothetical protein